MFQLKKKAFKETYIWKVLLNYIFLKITIKHYKIDTKTGQVFKNRRANLPQYLTFTKDFSQFDDQTVTQTTPQLSFPQHPTHPNTLFTQ